MHEKPPSQEFRLCEVFKVGQWYWVPQGVQTPRKDVPMELWAQGTPTTPGYYPKQNANTPDAQLQAYRLEFHPLHDNWRPYMDSMATLGIVRTDTEVFPAYMYSHPSPEFMGSKSEDSSWFMLRKNDGSIDDALVRRWQEPVMKQV